MGIEHEILGTALGHSNPSLIKDLQLVFSKMIHKLHYDVHAIAFFINRYISK